MRSSQSDKTSACEDETTTMTKDRRLKKRELDRKAQRMSRQRTKNRIAHLETMVAHLKQSDDNPRFLSLMDDLSQVTSERDKLLSALESLTFTIRGHIQDATGRTVSSVAEDIQAIPPQSLDQEQVLDSQESSTSAVDTSNDFIDPQLWLNADLGASNPHTGLSDGSIDDFLSHSALSQDMTILPTFSNLPPYDLSPLGDVIVPTATSECPCITQASQNGTSDINLWRAVNEVLARPLTHSQADAVIEDDFRFDDIAIRVVLEGWDTVEHQGYITESWRRLREVDELGWKKCRPTERLAVLRFIYMLMEYQSNPSPKRQESLPRWLWARPSQTLPHSRAIDFFAWPGLRERFVFFQHQYCANLFWHLFLPNLRVRWPFDFRDTYMQNAETGRFHLSPPFKQCIGELGSWTMAPDFFKQFPELYDDIAVYSGT
ncbi:hypothetical protein NM208_g315 [Fusarium decemcellulare]|uniref:Uncharacterized protein n=1 Tax=Fusarium decemcellulare TaxID=57161 RepID=A0ACC1T034_9HYPO|nr:hypothetical protein NM208_g315 [Fusarium decemcellulare]